MITRNDNVISAIRRFLRNRDGMSRMPPSGNETVTIQPSDNLRCAAECGAMVVTDKFVYPAPVIDAGPNTQLLSAGSPEQEAEEKLIVPL
jgi:hypothetical protein